MREDRCFFFLQAEDGIRDIGVTGVQTCALPICEVRDASRIKSEFLANVSHELRTPLNAIVGFVELLRDGVYGELAPRQTGPVQRIEASANHLRTLVDQILDLAKMAAGRLEVHTEIVDLRPFVLDVAGESARLEE